jgi:hypothetical protein
MSPQPVPVTVRAVTTVSPERTFRATAPIDLTLIFRGYGPLPAVVGVENQSGTWDHVGVDRDPVLSDGSTAHERLTGYHPPSDFAYEVSAFTNIMNRFVSGARGSWTFTPTDDGGTAVEWTYALRPRRFRTLAVRLLIAPLWRPYMRRALAATVREVHRQAALTQDGVDVLDDLAVQAGR